MLHGLLSNNMQNLLNSDLEWIYSYAKDDFLKLRGKKVFVTGGTGFFGKWLLYTFNYANSKMQSSVKDSIEITVLTRNPEQFIKDHPSFQDNNFIRFIKGDVVNFIFPDEQFDIVIHAATEASDKLNREKPQLMYETIVNGTKRILEFAIHCKAERFLLTSSGAVYERQVGNSENITEEFSTAPSGMDTYSAYAEGKKISELLAVIHAKQTGQRVLIARCFAFLGPFLPLDTHFAVGNFINDCLHNRDITIKGDGTAFRSYLYSADLVIWLMRVLTEGQSVHFYNVGSEIGYSIKEIAENVLAVWNEAPQLKLFRKNKLNYNILGATIKGRVDKYLPSTERIRRELNLSERIFLRESILRTFLFYLMKE
jgi:dTDP-glucose 4,6-dehydratase